MFFGDSIIYGEYDGVLGGYVDILKRYCHKKYNEGSKEVNVFNLGVGGETTAGLMKRISVEIEARKSPGDNLIFIAYGANDSAIKEENYLIPIDVFKMNLDKAIQISKESSDKIFIISILPISEKVDNVISPSGKLRTQSTILQYNTVLVELCKQHNVTYIDTFWLLHDERERLLSNDGIHPNEKGYNKIADYIKPIVEQYL